MRSSSAARVYEQCQLEPARVSMRGIVAAIVTTTLALPSTGLVANNVTDALSSRPELSGYTSLLTIVTPSVVESLTQTPNVTLFAPNNDAWSGYETTPVGHAFDSREAENLFRYHVINGTHDFATQNDAVLSTLLLPNSTITSVEGGAIVKYLKASHTLRSGLTNVTTIDLNNVIPFENADGGGEVWILDNVLQIPQNVTSTVAAINQGPSVVAFENAAVTGLEANANQFTVFLPSDEAWNNALGQSLSSLTTDQVGQLVRAHVVLNIVSYSAAMVSDMTTMDNTLITRATSSGGSSLGQNFKILTADIPFSNGVLHVIDRVLNPLDTTPQQSAASPAATATGSAGDGTDLSTGAKAGIGVGVALGVVAVAAIVFLLLKRRKRIHNVVDPSTTPDKTIAKPELVGGPYDPNIAGPVREKPELEPISTNASALPPELEQQHARHEYELPAATVAASAAESAAVPRQNAPKVVSRSAPTPQHAKSPEQQRQLAELAEEADTLVAELGVITKRKKALALAASATNMKPEEIDGRKGDEYRELLQREQKVRVRLAEVQDSL